MDNKPEILVGLIFQILSIYLMGYAFFIQDLFKIRIIYLSLGSALWAFAYWIMFDSKKEESKG